MGGIGVLDDVRPDERSTSAEQLARPGAMTAPMSTTKNRSVGERQAVLDTIAALRNISRAKAESNAARFRSPLTLAALAQAYGTGEAAVRAAREALDLATALEKGSLEGLTNQVRDETSIKIAVDVLVANGESSFALARLRDHATTPWLRLSLAGVAAANELWEEARDALAGLELQQAFALRGYLAARESKWSESVRELRAAIRLNPGDVDSLLNLSIALWRLGSAQKATKFAWRATRTSPGRRDVSMHLLDLLVRQEKFDDVESELKSLHDQGVLPNAGLTVVQARLALGEGHAKRAMTLLRRAAEQALSEGDEATRTEVLGNLLSMRIEHGLTARTDGLRDLLDLMKNDPTSSVAILLYAQHADRCSEAGPLREALAGPAVFDEARRAYLMTRLAVLEGDSAEAAAWAGEWFRLEPRNAGAAAAAIVSIGIGEERWGEASIVADAALHRFPHDRAVVNNSAYVLAMAGRAPDAIRILEGFGTDEFVLQATLGLAHLANGDIRTGTRLYREAADHAERVDPAWRSLMTAYQAIVVRQLALDPDRYEELQALLLAPVELPTDWTDRPDFVRMHKQFERHGYPWPPSPDLV